MLFYVVPSTFFGIPFLLLIIQRLFLGLIIHLRLVLNLNLWAYFPFSLFLFIPVSILVLCFKVHFRYFVYPQSIFSSHFLSFPSLTWFLDLSLFIFQVRLLLLLPSIFSLFYRLIPLALPTRSLYYLRHGLQHDAFLACSTSWSLLRTFKLRLPQIATFALAWLSALRFRFHTTLEGRL